jgi:hypothetical protein
MYQEVAEDVAFRVLSPSGPYWKVVVTPPLVMAIGRFSPS